VEQQRRENCAVAFAFDRILVRRHQEIARLVVANRRRLAFAAFRLRPLDAFNRVMGDGVFVAEIFEQRGQRRQPVADGAAAKAAARQLVAPGDDMGARDRAEFFRALNAGKRIKSPTAFS
jgi:hypothetical protein